jgi:hypothetical protein
MSKPRFKVTGDDPEVLTCLGRWREYGLVHECHREDGHSGKHVCKDFDCGSMHWDGAPEHEVHDEGPVKGFICRNCGNPIILTNENGPTIPDLIRDHEKECF